MALTRSRLSGLKRPETWSVRPGKAPSLRVLAPAKINLSLRVLGRRPDGHHRLDSLVAFAACADVLDLSPAPAFSLTLAGPAASALAALPVEDNLVSRAVRLLADACGRPAHVAVRLWKTLPAGGGIGGGSSDAAAALLGLRRLWDAAVSDSDLLRLGRTLGADVPVCLHGKAVRMTETGDVFSALPSLPPAWLVLVHPGVPLSTPAVFAARSGPFSASRPLPDSFASPEALALSLSELGNDLTPAALTLAPAVADCLEALKQSPRLLLAQMSGSGSTCWGLFAAEGAAQNAARALRRRSALWWVKAAPLLTTFPRFAGKTADSD